MQGYGQAAPGAVTLHDVQASSNSDSVPLRPGGDILQGWGERVKEALEDQGMTMSELARICDVNVTTIMRLTRGAFDPRIELKLKIAGALGMRVDRLWQWPTIVPDRPAA